ncbi:GspH/FimT family pseudopilin [Thalassomonas sp. M1454]|uniref:GspH/FimT family pseudopilin n=1 Tax=Thalassomonas sp. M1454 TaxID=2594477 RepID=UPI0011801E9F|nr:GspH/FimT family pseudopilin [Thalassomonas sp. M1454]TRX54420.1 prepilin-type N-terminal cleavage/methylation domain-containing protein [Thalassomonas sp. M1454]
MKYFINPNQTKFNNHAGFSLIELTVALSVTAILTSIGMPSYNDLIKKQQISADINRWYRAFNLARHTAIINSKIVTLCPSDNGEQCTSNWQDGGLIFVDDNKNHLRDFGEQLIQVIAKSSDEHNITWRAFQNRNYLQFQENGFTWAQNGTLRVCNSDTSLKYNRAIIVTRSGRLRLSQDINGDGIEDDASGKSITCS